MISKNFKKRTYISLVLILILFLIFNFISILFSLIVLSVLAIQVFLGMTKKIFKKNFIF